MTCIDHLPRLAVVASIMDKGKPPARSAEASLISSARLGGDVLSKAASATAAEPTPSERALAQALPAGEQAGGRPDDRAVEELLLLADDVATASELSAGLSEAFLAPGHAGPAPERKDRGQLFADLYRRFALHLLSNQVRNKAAAKLGQLTGARRLRGGA